MKALLVAILLTAFAAPCFAGPCADTQGAANAAIKERNSRVKESHNVLMPDPEEDRGPLSDCLGSVNSIGDVFTLGVKIPSMDQIVAGMCKQVNSMLQDKMNEALSEVKSKVSEIGQNNPFQVSGNGGDLATSLMKKLK